MQENISKIFIELCIHSKEIHTIEEFLNIQQHLNLENKSTKEKLIDVLKILSKHASLANIVANDEPESNCEELCENMKNLNKFLEDNLRETESFPKLILNICIEETKNIPNYHYRKILVDIVLKNPKIIPISQQFFSIIINKIIHTEINEISYNIDEIKKSKNIDYIGIINKTTNDVLNEIILNILENKFNLFFESITSEDLDKNILKR